MKPKENIHEKQRDLFRMELIMMVDMSHPLVRLAGNMEWGEFDKQLGATYHERLGQPGVNTRLMVSLHYLKYQYDMSDAEVVGHWVENPYWQYFSGMQYFEHKAPIDPSSMTRWRKRLGEAGAEQMLRQTIESAVRMKALKATQVEHINIDTTVQTKEIRYPTDGGLYDRARERLVTEARKQGLKIKQSYERVGGRLLKMSGRYTHARQMKRARACTRKLRTNLGRVIREIERQKPEAALQELLGTSKRIYKQKTKDKNKVYSVHEAEVECITKGKTGKKYEFGQKVSVAATSKGGWMLGALCVPGNPYDGHTLKAQMDQVKRLYIEKAGPKTAHVDMGYRGHNYEGPVEVLVDKRRRGAIPKRIWRWMKRRAAIEPTIGHLKNEHRLERNRLGGLAGDKLNAILSAAAMNFGKLIAFLLAFFSRLLLALFPAFRTSPCFRLA
jgi:IS5 family transposase